MTINTINWKEARASTCTDAHACARWRPRVIPLHFPSNIYLGRGPTSERFLSYRYEVTRVPASNDKAPSVSANDQMLSTREARKRRHRARWNPPNYRNVGSPLSRAKNQLTPDLNVARHRKAIVFDASRRHSATKIVAR